MKSDLRRQAIHISMGLLTLLLRFVTKREALGVCLLALFSGLYLLRPNGILKLGFKAMAREEDEKVGFLIGPLIYILTTTLCLAIFPIGFAGASMMIMAFGDGFSSIFGKKFGNHRISYNRKKTLEGSLAFVIFAFLASSFIMNFVSKPQVEVYEIFKLALAGSFLGAFLESLPFESLRGETDLSSKRYLVRRMVFDDNFFVPIFSGFFIYLVYLVS
ncbi:MAG: diacylglycerol/polyprenol kinase family protein [Candidatus Methanofastidiosia archaeon]